jgi:hypothetical protein
VFHKDALYQGTASAVPQKLQKSERALAPEGIQAQSKRLIRGSLGLE